MFPFWKFTSTFSSTLYPIQSTPRGVRELPNPRQLNLKSPLLFTPSRLKSIKSLPTPKKKQPSWPWWMTTRWRRVSGGRPISNQSSPWRSFLSLPGRSLVLANWKWNTRSTCQNFTKRPLRPHVECTHARFQLLWCSRGRAKKKSIKVSSLHPTLNCSKRVVLVSCRQESFFRYLEMGRGEGKVDHLLIKFSKPHTHTLVLALSSPRGKIINWLSLNSGRRYFACKFGPNSEEPTTRCRGVFPLI